MKYMYKSEKGAASRKRPRRSVSCVLAVAASAEVVVIVNPGVPVDSIEATV